ncbi:MAG: enoyl-CoA hydratase/isomerase family protein [Bdellovibrionaceae bacterium]|nr:enoyl-CoA hydratase/isomerase family protein [Pseudobdellovibrionaceae bacterium]
MSIQESLKIIDKGEIALLEWDLIGEKVNKLSSPVMTRLKELVSELKTSKYKAVVLISRKPKIFIAGADIEEIKNLKTQEEFEPVLKEAHSIFNLLEDLPMPTIAAIHGACLGGGCELVLACDYRIASDDKSTQIGLPEVKLGIIPGFGGCVRLPRVVGLQAALDIILAGKSVPSDKARKIGLVDEVVSAKELEERALAMAKECVLGQRKKRQKKYSAKGAMNQVMESALGRALVFNQARKLTLKESKGFYPAPLKALEVIQKTYGYSNREKALNTEMNGFCKVATTDISKYLIDLFYMLEDVKKQTGVDKPEVKPLPVKSMGVLGAGTMGGGIAYVAADKGIEARMKDISNEALSIGFKAARSIWEKKMQRRRLTQFDFEQKMNHISGTLDYSGFKHMDVVVEAIVEDMEIKKKVIGETAKNCKENCIMATNTSSLSVTEMANGHPKPENFLGMHFFNPVDKMPLVEVIRGEKTSDVATATIFDLAKKMGKTPVVVKDGPGFLVNRLLVPWMSEAIFLLQDGMSIEKLDRIYSHKFGMPMGPCRLLDEVGLDVAIKVVKIFYKSLGSRMEIPKLMEKLEGNTRLGKKNGKGFYLYDSKGKQLSVDKSIYQELGLEPNDKVDEKEVIERGIFRMINEAAMAMLEEKICENPQQCDLAMIMGTGFPPFRGGLLKYADTFGSEYIVQELEIYKSRYGERFTPAASLVNMAKTNKTFYTRPIKVQNAESTSLGIQPTL